MEWTVLAGGNYREDRFTCEAQPVATLVHGAFQISHDTIFSMVRKIVCGERAIWGDHSQRSYAVILTARGRIRAGASLLDAFACFARPDSRPDQLSLLIAHETMHAWLPRKLRVIPGPGQPALVTFSSFHDIRYDWFHEGFTEYLARLLLVQIGLASQEWFVERLNDDLAQLAIHPYRTASVRTLEDAVTASRYTNVHQRLSYLRGAALAFNWDAAIRRRSGGKESLISAMRSLLREAADHGGRLAQPRLEQAMEAFGAPARHDVERHALQGDAIPIDSAGLGMQWMLRYRSVPAFRPGFDVVASTNSDTVLGVEPGGPAHAAGLRDGMPIVRMANAWRWNDAWQADEPMTVVVRGAEGEQTVLVAAVHGETLVPYFVRRETVGR